MRWRRVCSQTPRSWESSSRRWEVDSGPRSWQGGRRTLIFKGIKVPSGFFFWEALLTREVEKMVQKMVLERFNGKAPATLSALHDLLEAPFKFMSLTSGSYEG